MIRKGDEACIAMGDEACVAIQRVTKYLQDPILVIWVWHTIWIVFIQNIPFLLRVNLINGIDLVGWLE